MPDEQGTLFYDGEADRWFERNAAALGTEEGIRLDMPLRLLELSPSYRPKRVLEVGCATGWRLHELRARYDCKVMGVEPSIDAIAEGKRRYGMDFPLRRGLARSLPIDDDERFDLVIAAFLFPWISPDAYMASVAELDRVTEDGGLVLVCDYLTDMPVRMPYVHLPAGRAHTYRRDVAQAFLGSGHYLHVARLTQGNDVGDLFATSAVESDERIVCDLLQKNLSLHVDL